MTPENWRRVDLASIVEGPSGIQTGPFGSQLRASEYVSEGIPVILPRDLAGNAISATRSARVTAAKASELKRYLLRSGDLVLARRGNIGRCALVTPVEEGWLCGTGCLRVRLAPGVDPGFLLLYLQWPATVSWMAENAVGQTMKNLSTAILSRMPLHIPPLDEQKKIVEILSSVEACITAASAVIDQTERIKQGLLQRLLAHGTSASLRGEHRLRPGARLPPGWETRPIGDLCAFVNGHGFKARQWATTGLPIIRIQNLNGSREFKYFAGRAKASWIVDDGELLFAWAGVKRVSFGPRIWSGPRGVLNQHIYRVQPREGVVKEWLFETLNLVTRQIEERAQGFKSSLLHIRKADITDHPVPVPPPKEQRAIAERSAFIAEMQAVEQSNLRAQAKLKHALMADLFTGRVSVAG